MARKSLSQKVIDTLIKRRLTYQAHSASVLHHLQPFTKTICAHLNRQEDVITWIDVIGSENNTTLVGKIVKNDVELMKRFGNVITITIPNDILDANNLKLFLTYLDNLQSNANLQHQNIMAEVAKKLNIKEEQESEDDSLPTNITKH